MTERPTVIILAAGQGTRMRSELPKVLHPIAGRPMVEWVIDAARAAGAGRVVCVTRPGDGVASALPDGVEHVEQTEGEGTGAAVLAARAAADGAATAIVLSGDHPLVSAGLVTELADAHAANGAAATLVTTTELDPAGYGRIVRGADGSVERIVETKRPEGVPPEELAIREINIGAYAFSAPALFDALDAVGEEAGEIYLTGVFPLLRAEGLEVAALATSDTDGALGVNDRAALMEVERRARRRLIEDHARAGVTFAAPDTVVIEAGVELGEDVVIEQGVTLRGATLIAKGAKIGPHSTLTDATIGEGAAVIHSTLVECEVGAGASVGPFAYLRPGTVLREGSKIGTFVEVKNSDIGAGTKVPHLSYLGDADVGENTNVGAGNITANYDGQAKHRTTIGKGVRTSVDTSFVAPVDVGDGAYTAAGSVITEDVPPGALGIARARQTNVEGYAKRHEQEERE